MMTTLQYYHFCLGINNYHFTRIRNDHTRLVMRTMKASGPLTSQWLRVLVTHVGTGVVEKALK
jgi:hypothetical protein